MTEVQIVTKDEIMQMVKHKKVEDDFFEISNKIKAILDIGLKNLKTSGFDNVRTETDDEELDNYLSELSKQAERIGDKFVRGLGQMYKGVLVKEELSVRENGGVYAYRCQWRMDYEQTSKLLMAHRDEVTKNMGEERSKIIFEIIDKIFKDEGGRKQSILQIDTSMASGEQKLKAFYIYDFDGKGSYGSEAEEFIRKGDLMRICKMSFNRGRITFDDEGGSSIGNRVIHKICLAKHKDVIAQIRQNIVNQLQARKNELNETEELIDNLLGKYLIAAELSNGKESLFM